MTMLYPNHKTIPAQHPFFEGLPVRISLTYCVFGLLWIIFSDTLLSFLIIRNELLFAGSSILKGTGFVGITTVGLYVLLSREERRRRTAEQTLEDNYLQRKSIELALHNSEERYRRIVETAYEGVWLADAADHTTFVNKRMAEMLGYTVEEMIGTSLFTFVHNEEHEMAVRSLEKRRQGITEQLECRLRRKDGSAFWVLAKATPFFDDGCYSGVLAMVTDITEEKQACEMQIVAGRRSAELQKEREIIELKERLVSIVSHELRTPLTVIGLISQLLEDRHDQFTPEQRTKKLHQIQIETQRMTNLLEDVLSLGKARAETLTSTTTPLDLPALCRDIVEQLELTDTTAHNIVFVVDGQFNNACLDESAVRRILTNLLSNAMKYSPRGTEVHFDLCQKGNEAVFRIQDNGIGISLEDQKRLFEPFHRASNARYIPGTGLGLAIVKEYVDRSGGTIIVESLENRGTTFTVRLPMCNS